MTLPDTPYLFIEDFIDKEYCDLLLSHLMPNKEVDPRVGFNGYGIGGKRDFIGLDEPKARDWDPENKIHEFVIFAHQYFLDNFPMVGEFELNRVHGNFMFPGAILNDHYDDRNQPGTNNPDEAFPIESIAHRTHVAGLFLTDDYEGGETCFVEHNISVRPKAGSIYLFPGYFTQHGVREVTSGCRVNILAQFFDVVDRDRIEEKYRVS
jgi:hypothetical protein